MKRQSRSGRVLVTGADGFIGSHLVERLVSQGRSVRAMVWYNARGSWGWLDSASESVRSSIEVVAGDIRDPAQAREVVRGCESVLHLAALIGIPYSYQAPESYFETNVCGTLNLLEAARHERVRRFVHTSTSEVYGTARSVPITEEHPLRAQSPYAASKTAADQLALSYFYSFELPVLVLRPFNTYGPRQSARAVIPTIICQLLRSQAPLQLGSLTPTRDFTYVLDTVAGFIAAADAPESCLGEVIQLGTRHEISIGDLASLLAELTGRELLIEADRDRARPLDSEVMRLISDYAKAERLLGWRPALQGREGLKKGLAETIAWFSDPAHSAWYRAGSYQV